MLSEIEQSSGMDPGGLSGIGLLTAKNLEGRGIRVIVVDGRVKGDAELYSSESVVYEDWWGKRLPRMS